MTDRYALIEAVVRAAGRANVVAAVERVYAEVQAAVEQRNPACSMSGRCCRFEEYGHRLYVTTLELAAFVAMAKGGRINEEQRRPTDLSSFILSPSSFESGCPFQVAKLCGVHAIRPFGCRMFFCDATATQWQSEAYERFHGEIKALHETLGVAYFYVEWRQAL